MEVGGGGEWVGVGGLLALLLTILLLTKYTNGGPKAFRTNGGAFLLGKGPFIIGTTRIRCPHVPHRC